MEINIGAYEDSRDFLELTNETEIKENKQQQQS